jgi:hypothetical protein
VNRWNNVLRDASIPSTKIAINMPTVSNPKQKQLMGCLNVRTVSYNLTILYMLVSHLNCHNHRSSYSGARCHRPAYDPRS